jgi:N utilization substance protein B
MASSSRRRSRILAFQTLFESEQHSRDTLEVLDRRLRESDLSDDGREFVRTLVNGVTEQRDSIDEVIARHASAFPLSEMAPVDRNVLRLAIYEVLFDNRRAPLRVAINEAVEIAKGYGSESSGRFVNGVLGAVALEAAERNESANHGNAPS